MTSQAERRCTAFAGDRRVASGPLSAVAKAIREAGERPGRRDILVFDDSTGRVVDLDLRGTPDEVAERHAAPPPPRKRPGRPKLGVVSKEVTLLPRHWAWLAAQRGGASAALRRLVDQARRDNEDRDQARAAQDAAYRFLSAVGGDRPGYEEAARALFRGERDRFEAEIGGWPDDFREHALRLADPAFGATDDEEG